MRLFETPRKVTKEPTYQFHLELTESEILRLKMEKRNTYVPSTIYYLVSKMIDPIVFPDIG